MILPFQEQVNQGSDSLLSFLSGNQQKIKINLTSPVIPNLVSTLQRRWSPLLFSKYFTVTIKKRNWGKGKTVKTLESETCHGLMNAFCNSMLFAFP